MDYARTVKRIANQEDITKVELHDILPSATVMVVVVTGTTTEGRALTEAEWKSCEDACNLAFELEKAKGTVTTIFSRLCQCVFFQGPKKKRILGWHGVSDIVFYFFLFFLAY